MARTFAGRSLEDLPHKDLAWMAYWRSVGYLTSEPLPTPPATAGDICSKCGEPFVGGETVRRTSTRFGEPARFAHLGSDYRVDACLVAAEPHSPTYRRVLALILENEPNYEIDPDLIALAVEELRR